ncbi:N-acetylneuraminate synthase family protein [Thalassospira sp. ER-Se-21-Dark]|uniref:N-acetylneuraminate synthase family protein n=1 Tax=Thalassospira sp. ER-Se-21-Dark TaxID=2585190 RepID=UPI001B310256|nr:N-acetylneuraminate synthase family protein [Thalassospira sp. ER-Se-21-Dark]MBP3128270.1 N-acylneuraminate-9-phosphate synthase [Thalassospira sp. ER-Se-21-Dark]
MFRKEEIGDNAIIIAEVGQNHQGDIDLAREYIKVFSAAGADVIKFQTRNNKYLFSKEAYESHYDSENAFADVYGHHREKLELDPKWLPILKEDCEQHGVKFMSTPFDEPSLDVLCSDDVNADAIKIASFDIGNLPLIHKIGKTKKPVAMSIGGGKTDQIRASVEALLSHHDDIAILHCVSEYPCDHDRLGLNNIDSLIENFPQCTIGYSDHFNGILPGPLAFMKGARVFEKHVTLNRAWKGTDHSFALENEGFRKFVRDIRRTPQMMPPKPVEELGSEYVFKKLGKSLTAYRDIKAGEVIDMDSLSGRIFKDQHIPVRESNRVIGRIAKNDIVKGSAIKPSDIENW